MSNRQLSVDSRGVATKQPSSEQTSGLCSQPTDPTRPNQTSAIHCRRRQSVINKQIYTSASG